MIIHFSLNEIKLFYSLFFEGLVSIVRLKKNRPFKNKACQSINHSTCISKVQTSLKDSTTSSPGHSTIQPFTYLTIQPFNYSTKISIYLSIGICLTK